MDNQAGFMDISAKPCHEAHGPRRGRKGEKGTWAGQRSGSVSVWTRGPGRSIAHPVRPFRPVERDPVRDCFWSEPRRAETGFSSALTASSGEDTRDELVPVAAGEAFRVRRTFPCRQPRRSRVAPVLEIGVCRVGGQMTVRQVERFLRQSGRRNGGNARVLQVECRSRPGVYASAVSAKYFTRSFLYSLSV